MMDIERNQRLSKFSNLIKDMVNYLEISDYLLQSRVISVTDHTEILECIEEKGNSSAMEDLVDILGLRRGGFNILVGALRQNDYDWLADQMDPSPIERESSPKGFIPTLSNGLKKRKSRASERLSTDTIFTSYRRSIPMDLNFTRPKSKVSQELRSSTSNILDESPAKFITASLDNLNLDEEAEHHSRYQSNATEKSFNTITRPISERKRAIIYNIPESEKSEKDMELVSEIAKQLDFPQDFLKGLKTCRIGRISKHKSYLSRPLKVKFKSVEACDRFIKLMKDQLTSLSLEPSIGNVEVVPYAKKEDKELSDETKGLGKKRHWYRSTTSLFSNLSLKRNKTQRQTV